MTARTAPFRADAQRTGAFAAANPTKGSVRWTFTAAGPLSSPVVADGVVYVGDDANMLFAIKDGTKRWETRLAEFSTTEGHASSPPAVDGDIVYAGTDGNALCAVDAKTGKRLWDFETGGQVWSSPLIIKNKMYFGSWDSRLYCLDLAAGKKPWERKLWDFRARGQLHASPAFANGTVFIGCDAGFVYALDAASGAQRWAFATKGSVYTTVACADGALFVSSQDGALYAIDGSGTERWKYASGGFLRKPEPIWSSPAVRDGVAYCGIGKSLCAIDINTGKKQWDFKTRALVETSPVLAGSTVYFGSGTTLHACDLSGKERWAFDADGPVHGSPAVTDDGVSFVTNSGTLYLLS